MYLKRIEMQGFKSFADKTVIELKQGITTVIGPNGSGKSNISDAIRWVLGEQSSKSIKMFKITRYNICRNAKQKIIRICRSFTSI